MAHVGRMFGFAFPAMDNDARTPITLKAVRLVSVPRGMKVVKYRMLSIRDTSDYLLGSVPGNGDRNDYAKFTNYPVEGRPPIGPGKRSPFYPVAYVEITGPLPIKEQISGCEYDYLEKGRLEHQTLKCAFGFRAGE